VTTTAPCALTGVFLFGFSAMQIPCGFLFDRFGPRLTVFAMVAVLVVGWRPTAACSTCGRATS
jgi:MFS family permease